jgi:hypothetical protein
MKIEAFDLATKCGLAWGATGEIPRSESFTLGKGEGEASYDHLFGMCGSLTRRLFSRWRFATDRPNLVVVEHPVPMQRGKTQDPKRPEERAFYGGVSPAALLPWQLAGVVCGLAEAVNIRVERVWPGTVTAFMCHGMKVKKGERKDMLLQRVHALGLLNPKVTDKDRSDAVAIWYWAQCTIARYIPSHLVLMGEAPHRRDERPD